MAEGMGTSSTQRKVARLVTRENYLDLMSGNKILEYCLDICEVGFVLAFPISFSFKIFELKAAELCYPNQ